MAGTFYGRTRLEKFGGIFCDRFLILVFYNEFLWGFFGSLSKVPRKFNGFFGKPLKNVRKTQKSPVKIQIIKNSIKIYEKPEFFEKFSIDGARKN